LDVHWAYESRAIVVMTIAKMKEAPERTGSRRGIFRATECSTDERSHVTGHEHGHLASGTAPSVLGHASLIGIGLNVAFAALEAIFWSGRTLDRALGRRCPQPQRGGRFTD